MDFHNTLLENEEQFASSSVLLALKEYLHTVQLVTIDIM